MSINIIIKRPAFHDVNLDIPFNGPASFEEVGEWATWGARGRTWMDYNGFIYYAGCVKAQPDEYTNYKIEERIGYLPGSMAESICEDTQILRSDDNE